jgi:2-iminobutanoate/2-iminopropanoate deaminase
MISLKVVYSQEHPFNYQTTKTNTEVTMFTSEGKNIIQTEKAPKAIGPYSQAIRTENMVFTAGQIALNPSTGELVQGGIEEQTHQVLTNLKHILEAADSGLAYVVKTTVFLKDMADFPKMNAIYAEFFPKNAPARSTIVVAALPKDGMIEVEAVALLAPRQGD